jgi:hypothetical protein
MASNHDVFNDPNHQQLARIFQELETPEFVKEAAVADEESMRGVSTDLYADPSKRLWPLNNKSNTWLSREYFKSASKDYSHKEASLIKAKIEKAARFWGLDEPRQVAKAPTVSHAVEIRHGDDVVSKLDISSPVQFKEACDHLKANCSNMTYDMRRSMARGLCGAPAEYKQGMDDQTVEFLEKTAGFGMGTYPDIAEAIYKRIVCIGHTSPEMREVLVKTAHELSTAQLTPEMLHKTAGMLDLVDRTLELHRQYGRGMTTPEEDLFKYTQKMASTMKTRMVELANGSTVDLDLILSKKASVDGFFQKYVGEVPYGKDDTSGMVDIIRSLPRPDADAFEQALND